MCLLAYYVEWHLKQELASLLLEDEEIADELALPFENISVEMVFRGIYHFTQALNQGIAIDLIAYLTASSNRDLGIVKFHRPKRAKPPLNLSPSPS